LLAARHGGGCGECVREHWYTESKQAGTPCEAREEGGRFKGSGRRGRGPKRLGMGGRRRRGVGAGGRYRLAAARQYSRCPCRALPPAIAVGRHCRSRRLPVHDSPGIKTSPPTSENSYWNESITFGKLFSPGRWVRSAAPAMSVEVALPLPAIAPFSSHRRGGVVNVRQVFERGRKRPAVNLRANQPRLEQRWRE